LTLGQTIPIIRASDKTNNLIGSFRYRQVGLIGNCWEEKAGIYRLAWGLSNMLQQNQKSNIQMNAVIESASQADGRLV